MILEELLRWLSDRKCPTVLLDASAAGVHMYEKRGFIHKDVTHIMQQKRSVTNELQNHRKISPDTSDWKDERAFEKIAEFDGLYFGANRKKLLRSYCEDDPRRFLVSFDSTGKINGYLACQNRVIGPWVVSSKTAAEDLLSNALKFSFVEQPTVFVSASNSECMSLLSLAGFESVRSLSHMYMGQDIERARSTGIYGMATLGFG